jgi:hypothetical protein
MSTPRTLLAATAAGLASGALGALLVVVLAPGEATPGGPLAMTSTEAASLVVRVAALENENRLLRAQVDTLADRPGEPVRLPSDLPTRAEFEALARLVEEGTIPADPEALAAVPPPLLEAAVGQVLDKRAEAARLERARREREKLDERVAKQVERWTEELGLTPYQAERLTDLVTGRELDSAELKGAYNSGRMTAPEVKADWQAREADYRRGLEETLMPDQLAGFERITSGAKDSGR